MIHPKGLPVQTHGHSDRNGHSDPSQSVPNETLNAFIQQSIALEPKLGQESVAWRVKTNGDGSELGSGRCPFPHASGTSAHGDLYLVIGPNGTHLGCHHSTCKAPGSRMREVARQLRAWSARQQAEAEVGHADPIALAPIALAYDETLRDGRVALHIAGTGAGKSRGAAEVALHLVRQGIPALIASPTMVTCDQIWRWIEAEFQSPAAARHVVAQVYGHTNLVGDADEFSGDSTREGDVTDHKYPIFEHTMIVITTHEQLRRRGFSKFHRGIWNALERRGKGKEPFRIIIDEASVLIDDSRLEIPLEHRVKFKKRPDKQAGYLVPVFKCPKTTRSGNCSECRLVNHGGRVRFDAQYSLRELNPPHPREAGLDWKPFDAIRDVLQVDSHQIITTPENRMGDHTFVCEVTSWYGVPIDAASRRTANVFSYRTDPNTDGAPPEKNDEIMAHLLRFAHKPMITREYPVDSEGDKQSSEELAYWHSIAPQEWDEGIIFPFLACETARLLMTDMLPLELLRRHAEKEGVGIVFAGATMLPDDREILRNVFPNLEEIPHEPTPRKIGAVALVFPKGRYGQTALVETRGGRRTLLTAGLEKSGRGMIFCSYKADSTRLFKAVAQHHRTVRHGYESGLRIEFEDAEIEEPNWRTLITYARSVLGMGTNLTDIRWIVVNAESFRPVSSFTPSETTPEAYQRARTEERTARIVQNLGRGLRGEAGKPLALIVLNADEDLQKRLAQEPSIIDGCEQLIVQSGRGLKVMIQEAAEWLAAGGEGPWPNAKPERETPKGRKPTKTVDDIRAAIPEAKASGKKWSAFSRSQHLDRLTPELRELLKVEYAAGLVPA